MKRVCRYATELLQTVLQNMEMIMERALCERLTEVKISRVSKKFK